MATATITFTDGDGEVTVTASFGGVAVDPVNSDAHAMAMELLGMAGELGEVTSAKAKRVGEHTDDHP